MYKVELYIEGEQVDLYDDEIIRVESSVQNIRDISKSFDDFSQSFTMPASPRNNAIFQHWYDAWIDGFDARIRHDAYINLDGVRVKTGTVLLEGAKMEKGNPTSYRGTFYGLLTNLTQEIGDDLLSDLDLAFYGFDFSYSNINTGLTSGLKSGSVLIPLISTKRQWLYDSNVGTTTHTDTLTNIAANGSGADHGIDYASLRPALKVIRIIQAIEQKYDITFSRDFIHETTGPIANLFLWLANKDGEDTLNRYTRVTNYENINNVSAGSFDNSTGTWTPVTQAVADLADDVSISTDSTDGIQYTLQLMDGNNVVKQVSGTGNLQVDHSYGGTMQKNAQLYMRIVSQADKAIDDADFTIDLGIIEFLNVDKNAFNITSQSVQISAFIPSMKVVDFLKGLNKMFNMVVVPTSATAFTFEALNDWYLAGTTYDISAYVDRSETGIERPNIYREISFTHEDPSTLLAKQFKDFNATPYGDLSTKILAADGSKLDGEEYEIEVPFEQMVYEKLVDQDDSSDTNIVYGLSLDSSLSQVFPQAHLLYIQQRSVSANPIHLLDEAGNANTLNGNVYMPSHASSDLMEYSTTFGAEINEHLNQTNFNSLFRLRYQDYITDSFSVHRRLYRVKAKLPVWLLEDLKLNDKLRIDGVRYIINNMVTELNTGMVDFELLNDIFNLDESITTTDQGAGDTPVEPPATTGESFSTSSNGAFLQGAGCSLTINTVRYVVAAPPDLTDVVYTNSSLSTPFDGQNKYYKIANDRIIRIDASGVVTDKIVCSA